jgi:hypothetical protein
MAIPEAKPQPKTVDTRDKDLPEREAIVTEYLANFRAVSLYERHNRIEARDDLRMIAGFDHWPAAIARRREEDKRPVLTVNKLPSFVDQVLNEARLNKVGIKVVPKSGGATKELAETFEGLIREIEDDSNADVAYFTGLEGGVNNGFGFFRVVSEYSEDDPWNQVLKIKRVKNQFTVYLDPSCQEADGSDAGWGFVTELISGAEYKARYPGIDPPSQFPSEENRLWFQEDMHRIAEYWVKEPETKRLILLEDGRTVYGDEWDKIVDDLDVQYGEAMAEYEAMAQAQAQAPAPTPQAMPGEMPPPQEAAPQPQAPAPPLPPPPPKPPGIVKEREVKTHKVMQYLVDGVKIIEKTEWPGRYIPIFPVYGKETVIDEETFRRGLIRFAKDPQKMYDYFRTASTDTVALTPKAPYIMEEGQIEGHEDEWEDSAEKNQAYLLYSAVAGVPPPTRQVVTQTAIGEMTESSLANDEMKATTSLFDASLGAQGNEISGRAIQARQQKGDVANYAYHDNLTRAIKFCGKVLVDLIPRIYDTERQILVMDREGKEQTIMVNQVVLDVASGDKVIINDLTQGKYKVTTTTGPRFSSARQEALASMLDFIRVAPESANQIMDLVAENMDWPGAETIAKRFRVLLGVDEETGEMQPPGPSNEDIFLEKKIQGSSLSNEKRKLDIIEKKRELGNTMEEVAHAGAQGALTAFMGQQGRQ